MPATASRHCARRSHARACRSYARCASSMTCRCWIDQSYTAPNGTCSVLPRSVIEYSTATGEVSSTARRQLPQPASPSSFAVSLSSDTATSDSSTQTATYQAGARRLPVTRTSQVATNCAVPPKIVTASA